MRARLIVNPRSGTDRAPALLPLVVERLHPLAPDLDVTLTTGEQDVVRAASRAVQERCDLLFIAGGDGTVNLAVDTVAAVEGALGRIAFGIIPAGTGNDFAKALDVGEDAEAALDVLVRAQVIDVDLGFLNDRAFVNISAGGFVADVSAILTDELKDATGKLSYVIGGARALLGREPFAVDIRLPNSDAAVGPFTDHPHTAPLELQMFAVCNARFIGGGHPIAPAAVIDDGLLDVLLVKRTATLEFVALLQRIAAGEHMHDDRVVHFRSADFELVFDRFVNVNTDGEVLESDHCRYRARHRAARFLCGAHPQAAAPPRSLMV